MDDRMQRELEWLRGLPAKAAKMREDNERWAKSVDDRVDAARARHGDSWWFYEPGLEEEAADLARYRRELPRNCR